MKKVFKNIFLGLALTACTATPLAVGLSTLGKTDGDASVKNDGGYVLLEELWNEETNSFYSGTVKELFNLIGGESDTTIEKIKELASSTKQAKELRINTYKKKSTQDINVMLGGLEWTVCYLSNDKNGNPILTLWLSNSTQEKFQGRAEDEGIQYSFYDGGMYGVYNPTSFNTTENTNTYTTTYFSSVYGTSYMRAVVLNNGGKYAISSSTLSDEVAQNENNVFSLFTMEEKGLTDYIVKPVDVSWQENQNAKSIKYTYNFSNDAWAEQSDEGFYVSESRNYNLSAKDGYDEWKNDYIWLPSITEVGGTGNVNLWGINLKQKTNYDGQTANLNSSKLGTIYTSCFLRSSSDGSLGDLRSNISLTTGGRPQAEYSYHKTGIRPALHLNLNAIAESLSEENCYEIVYDLDGGKSGVYPTKMENTSEFILTNPTRNGYKFIGWQISGADYSTAMFGKNSANLNITSADMTCYVENCDKLHFKNLTSIGGSVTLKAIWQSTGEVMIQYKSYDDYFTDYDISSSTITENDLSGSGTSTDPYRAKTTKGFLYLTNKTKSGINLNNKYVEIECDILLNDETFDENGNPLTGDKIVYSWNPINSYYAKINGNNHTIYGLYFNDIEVENVAVFGVYLDYVKNLNTQNVFVQANGGASICYYARDIENCHALGGTIISTNNHSAGVSIQVDRSIHNCSNYINVSSRQGGGVVARMVSDSTIEKTCSKLKNYGKIQGSYVGGIICFLNDKTTMEGCENFGEVVGEFSAGIFYKAESEKKLKATIVDCANYGNVYTYNRGAGFCVNIYDGEYNFIRCKNEAEVKTNTTCAYVGAFLGNFSAYKDVCKITVKDCSVTVKNNIPVFYAFGDWNYYTDLKVENLSVEYDVDELTINSIFGSKGQKSTTMFNNIVVKVKCNKFNASLFSDVNEINNLYLSVEAQGTVVPRNNYLYTGSVINSINGVMLDINSPTTSIKHYYGSNFSGFYIAWRTGKIGLKALDGVGYFQGAIDEEWLGNNGFVKKN